jgi:hypothetical protein
MDSVGLRHRRKLMLPTNNEDEAQDRVPLAERMRQAPPVCCITPPCYYLSLPLEQELPLPRWVLVGHLGPHQLPLSLGCWPLGHKP